LQGGGGNDTYIFNLGDDTDTIIDSAGNDTLQFGEGITSNDIIVKASVNSNDLIVALKEDGKTFDQLTDKITLKNWFNADNRIESFSFSDGSLLDIRGITQLQVNNSGDDYLRFSEQDDMTDMGLGNDTIEGGDGNDTYLYNIGDGHDTIQDVAGIDTIRLGNGISTNNLEIHSDNEYLIIGFKQDGVAFSDLSDKLYIKRVGLNDYGIENLEFSDGTIIDPRSLISTYDGTDGSDIIDLAYLQTINPTVSIDDSLVINAKGGNDTVTVGNGANTIDIGDGYYETLTVGNGDNKINMGSGWGNKLNAGDGNNSIAGSYITAIVGAGDNNFNLLAEDSWVGVNIKAGDGNNSVFEKDAVLDTSYWGGEGYLTFTAGDGNNTIQIGQKLSKEIVFDDLWRDTTIIVGDGINDLSFNNGDGNLDIVIGNGNNKINFTADIDDVSIQGKNGDNVITQIDDNDIENSYYDWYYDETTGNWQQSTLTIVSDPNTISIGMGEGNNTITLSDTAQDYQLNLGNGNNTIIVGKENSDNNYTMNSSINMGNGNNQVDIVSGDGILNINGGTGNNSVLFSSDIDNVTINMGDGNNTITQKTVNDTDNIAVQSIMQGYIQDLANGSNSVDQWVFNYSGGNLQIDVLTEMASGEDSPNYQDINHDGIQQGFDSTIYLYRKDTFGNWIYVNSNDDSNGYTDGSTSGLDSYLGLDLAAGEYLLSIGGYYLSDEDARIGYQRNNITGPYQLTFTGDVAFNTIPESAQEIYSFNPNSNHVDAGDGDNQITLSDVAQDYQLNLGSGDNTITVGKENSDNNYAMDSSISMGDGNNSIDIQSGDGNLNINAGEGNNSIEFSADIDNTVVIVGDGNNTIVQKSVDDTDIFYNANNVNLSLGLGANTIATGSSDDEIYLSDNAYNELNAGMTGQADNIDTGAGSNYIDIKSNANHTVSIGDANYQNLSTYQGNDYDELYLGNGNNTVNSKGSDKIYAEIGNGNNTVNIANTQLSSLFFDGGDNFIRVETLGDSHLSISNSGNTNVSMGSGDTLVTFNENITNTISTGAGNDDVYTYDSDDTYLVNIGDGSDAILDMYGTDKVVFGAGITKDNLKVRIEFNDDLMNHTDNVALAEAFRNYNSNFDFNSLTNANLVIQYSDNPSDILILANWYEIDNRIESFVFSDGTTLSDHQIVSLIETTQDDLILGTEGDNTLQGGQGADEIDGGVGNDTYIYNRGDSYDTFNEDGGFDTISFGQNITKNDLILQQVDNNLLISLKEDGKTLNDLSDTITVNNWFDESGRIERFTFSDGSSMELDEILGLVDTDGVIYYGTPNEDLMEGSDNGDIIMARDSNDIVNGNRGNDLLFGEAGDDILDGGEGDDLLYGGEGNDTYIIDRNMGSDTVFDQSGNDTLKFVNGITADDVEVWFDNNDLKVWTNGTEVTLSNWYASDNRIETFSFDDGTTLNVNDIINLQYEKVKGVSEGTTFNVDDGDQTIYYGQNGNDIYRIDTYSGDNTISDSAGNDRIEFVNGITPDRVALSYEGDDLILSVEETTVRLSGWYTTQNRIEIFAFEDGTTLTAQNIIDLMGTDGNDSIRSRQEGGELHGNSGDDTLAGSKGDDLFFGGEGNDTYLINEFAGVDVIDDMLGVDTIRFGGGITPDSLRVTWIQGSEDIYISSKDDVANGLILKNWYSSDGEGKILVFSDGTIWTAQNILDAMGSVNDDVYDGFNDRANMIRANGGSDAVCTFGFDDTVDGGAGDDALDTGAGNDTLIGGAGDDLLFGGVGSDTYCFDRGFGKDMIYDFSADGSDGGNDRIVFGDGISADDIIVKSFENDNNLYIGLKEDGKTFDELSNVITIKDWFLLNNRIESIAFGDAADMSLLDLMRAQASQHGDAIRALAEGGMLIGTENNDTLIGNSGDDFILGLGGDDILVGGEGNDTLIGGSGGDLLEGSSGNDTYFFGKGDGKDTIYDNATAVQEQYGYVIDSEGVARWSKIEKQYNIDGGVDTLYFGDGITADDLSLSNDGYDLVITLKDLAEDTIRIQDYYKPLNTIEYFGFSDGSIMSNTEFEALLFTPGDDNVTFIDEQDHILNGNDGNDIINGGSGNDIIDGEGGDDTLNGGFGDDTYLFGRGSGHDTITDNGIGEWWQTQSGNDTVVFKDGLTSNDLWIKTVGIDVIIGIKEEGKTFEELSNTLTIKGALDVTNPFESVLFADGTNVTIETLLIQNTPPEAQAEITHTLQDIRIFSGDVGATDIDNDILTYTVSTAASHGTLNVDENGKWSYSAVDGYMGSDSAIITIDDSNGGVITQTLNFEVKVSAPTLSDTSSNLLEDTATNGVFNVTNPIGGVLVYEVLNTSTKGAFSVDESGSWNYNPNANLNGSDSVTIKVTNAYGLSTTATLNLAIEAVNDAPILTETPAP
ncbi:calcium-binding protein, partial [Sulfuricurvum sp.]|uniref:calcium-binding protein n=1 Tax=Sulfuricurvum sp. TaxID=2025608 RepID=UPI002630E6BB